MCPTEPDPERLDRLFDELCRLPESERGAFLDQEAGNAAEREILEQLLDHFDDSEASVAPLFSRTTVEDGLPQTIGVYRVVRHLGSGGMGAVYLAEQESPSRLVAVKRLLSVSAGGDHLKRFELEAELLGRLQHPGIAQVFELNSELDQGVRRPYLVMEYIEGIPVTEYCEAKQLDVDERVKLLIDVIHAVQHAHLRGVVHRDLKPSNVLVTDEGAAKVIDFGVARASEREEGASMLTGTGQIVGTLAYMSPEQARGDLDRIDGRADVFALGALAYELFSGSPPHDLKGKSITAAAQIVCEKDATRLGLLKEALRGDLEWIVARALEKEPERRYQSAEAMARDLERYLANELVEAGPISAGYRLKKFVRRHRAGVAGTTVAFLALIVGGGLALNYAIRNADLVVQERQASQLAQKNFETAKRNAEEATLQAELAAEREIEAREQSELAEQRATDLEIISNFRLAQIRDIDPAKLGGSIQREERALLKLAMRREGLAEEQAVRLEKALDELQAEVGATDLGRNVVLNAMIRPTLTAIHAEFANRPRLRTRMLLSQGTSLLELGDLDLALTTYREALSAGSALDPLHPDVVTAQLWIGICLVGLGQVSEGQLALEPALELAEEVPEVEEVRLIALGNLAQSLARSGQLEEGLAVFREQEELQRRAYVPGDPPTTFALLVCLYNMGIPLLQLGRIDEAFDLTYEMELILEEFGTEDEEMLLMVLETRGGIEHVAGNHEVALELYGSCREILTRTHGAEHVRALKATHAVAKLELALGNFERAETLARSVVESCRAQFGEGHPLALNAGATLERVLLAAEK